ncbi:MAG: hypothetical protein IKX45_08025 [Bacteroidales bacterium]|nr:hypothetical protein [Bacteroidales bacterium]
MATVSCTEKEELAPAGNEKVLREFSTVLTKTTLHTDGRTVYWEEGDAISIFDGVGNNKFDITGYDNGSPSASATFSGSVDGGATEFYAVYPYAAGNTLAGSTVTATVPAAQTLKAGSFESGAAVAVARTTTNALNLHNATALLGIVLTAEMTDVESIEFSGNNDEYVAGPVSATLNGSGDVTAITPGTGSKTVILTGTFAASGTYYLSFIPQTFTKGVKVIVTFDGGKTAIATSSKSLATEAGTSYNIANFTRVTLPSATFGANNSFNYDSGAAQNLAPVSYANIASVTVDSAPAGWDIAWNTDHFEVTPPTQAEIQATPQTVDPAGTFEITLRSAAGHTRELELPVRLYGVNSVAELKALRSAQDTPANAEPYLVNNGVVDEIVLNVDLTLQTSDLQSSAIALHHNTYPINGNGRTVTYDNVNVSAWPSGFIQNLMNDVHDINFTGSITSTAANAKIGALASRGFQISGDEVVVTNVTSDVDITWTAAASNTCIGGLVGWMDDSSDANTARNKSITFVDCSVSGDIVMNGEVLSAGGILGQGEKRGTVATAYTTFNGCTYTGNITYTPDATQGRNTRIGGIVGNSERQLKVINTTSAGRIDVNLNNKIFGTNGAQAIGGFFGRSSASADGYYMDFYLDNCSTSTDIYVWGTNASEWKNAFQIRGYGLCARSGPDASGNIAVTGGAAIHFDYYAGPEINAAGTTSFAYGASSNIPVTTDDLTDWDVAPVVPEGWTVNVDHIKDGSPYIAVTAPSQAAIRDGSAVGIGDITFTVTHAVQGSAPAGGTGPTVRLYGINNKTEFNAFKTVYGAMNDSRVVDGLEDYMVDGRLTLNTDLSFSSSDFYVAGGGPAYVIKWLYDELDGNNKTITFNNVTSASSICAFFQGIKNNVGRLNFAGAITSTNGAAEVGTLASRGGYAKVDTSTGETVVSYVNSSAHIISQPSAQDKTGAVGGLIGRTGYVANVTQRFDHCIVSGTIENETYTTRLMGGFIGGTGSVVDPLVQLDDCEFSGTLIYRYGTNSNGCRNGGLIGSVDRQAILNRCIFSGTIKAYMNGNEFTSGGYNIGGVVGRTTASAGGNTMKCEINDFTYSGTITAYDATATTWMGTCIGADAGFAVTRVDGVQPLTSASSYNFPATAILTASSE